MDDGLSGTRHDRGRLHQHIEVVERIAGFDEGHPVPFERLLDEQRRAKLLVERPRAFVAGDHPDDETVGAVRALRVSDRRYELAPDTRALVTLRRLTARLHRMASGMHMALFRAMEDPSVDPTYRGWFEPVVRRLQPIERDVIAAQTQLRLLREELDLQAGQQTNENVYLLSVITALFMPATLVTGFFGMNTGGMPLEGAGGGTFVATIVAVLCSLATWLLLRTLGLIRR